jgi:hypothetical protein
MDIALTDAGPLVLENNVVGDVDLPQLVLGQGVLAGPFREVAKELGALDYPGTRKVRRLWRRWRGRFRR